MIRFVAFLVLAGSLGAYAFWVYRRAELPVSGARWMALMRATVLVVILALLFDPKIPGSGDTHASPRWVVVDASLSMSAGTGNRSGWDAALERAAQLASEGWTVAGLESNTLDLGESPVLGRTRLGPALERAAEAGAHEVLVLSDLRVDDAPAVRAALAGLPLAVTFEAVGGDVANAGASALRVPDAPRPGEEIIAEVEVHGHGNDSISVDVLAGDEVVGSRRVALPDPGLRLTVEVPLAAPSEGGRVRYAARVSTDSDDFASDDEISTYASVGYEEGALILVSLEPDWEPRYLLPVLEEVTGLPAAGYLRIGEDRFVPVGPAVDRSAPVDSVTVGRAVDDAEIVIVHGASRDDDAWAVGLSRRSGRTVVLPADIEAAARVGVRAAQRRSGEWYASADVPPSSLSGDLAGAALLGLPPLTDVLVPERGESVVTPLHLQFRGTGAPEAAMHLEEREGGRRAVTLSSGYWRWAMRDGAGRDAYRRLWSGVAGWLLASDDVVAPEPRPTSWVFQRDEAVRFSVPGDSTAYRLVVEAASIDTTLTGGGASVGVLEPGTYPYRFESGDGDVVGEGAFDVLAATAELVPVPADFEEVAVASAGAVDSDLARPFRTSPWPYLLVILLLCGEWVMRRRSGLR